MKHIVILTLTLFSFCACTSEKNFSNDTDIVLTMNYPIVGTNQTLSFNDREIISPVYDGSSFTDRTPIIRAIFLHIQIMETVL